MLGAVPGIDRIRIQGFGCIEDVELELGPLQAFIGPNDSGKSTILRAVAVAVSFAVSGGDSVAEPRCRLNASIVLGLGQQQWVELKCYRPGFLGDAARHVPARESLRDMGLPAPRLIDEVRRTPGVLRGGTALVRLDPDALREPSQLIPEGQELGFFTDRGAGLAGLFDALMNRSDRPVDAITARVRERFPTVKHIGLRNASTTHKELQIELVDGTKVPASMASEGLLYYLAFATLPYLHGNASILLVEEPENGLHPARIRDVVTTLREISQTTQVLIATHSPILVNELQPHEVFVTTRDPKTGTRVTRLDRTHNFAERARVYHPGELWVAYADGDTEAALLGEDGD
jgi:energy-coupling factor transporter ATP-binding protein EcfA2